MAHAPLDDYIGIDYFLGLMPDDFEVSRHACDLIDRESSEPNLTHAAIVRIADSTGALQIVMTNFDMHLLSAAAAADREVLETLAGPTPPHPWTRSSPELCTCTGA